MKSTSPQSLINGVLRLGKGIIPSTKDRLKEVIKDAFLAGQDIYLGDHAGNDWQRISPISHLTGIGFNPNQVISLSFPIYQGVCTDMGESGIEPPIGRKVERSKAHAALCPG